MNSVDIFKMTNNRKVKEIQQDNQTRILQYRSGEISRYEFFKSMCRRFKQIQFLYKLNN